MKRRLRIAVSVFFAVFAVFFAALWVRSYLRGDSLQYGYRSNSAVSVSSIRGVVSWTAIQWPAPYGWQFRSAPLKHPYTRRPQFEWLSNPQIGHLRTPHWLFVISCAALGASPWLAWRFSVRTLLFATTLVAVVLGLVVLL